MKSNRKAARRERRAFTAEFKAEAVRLVAERRADGARLSDVSRELRTPRQCLLLRRGDQGWQGTCNADNADAIALSLIPPNLPDVPTGLARAAYESDIPWIEERAGRLRVLIQTGGAAAAHAAKLRNGAVVAFDSAFALLNETPPDIPFGVIYVDSRAEMRQLAGSPAGGWADGVARAAANTVTGDGSAPDRHEIMHVAATVAWGIPANPWPWISEGVATYAPLRCAGAEIHALAAALIANGRTAPVNSQSSHRGTSPHWNATGVYSPPGFPRRRLNWNRCAPAAACSTRTDITLRHWLECRR